MLLSNGLLSWITSSTFTLLRFCPVLVMPLPQLGLGILISLLTGRSRTNNTAKDQFHISLRGG